MGAKLDTIVNIETSKSNNIFTNYFIGVNLIFIFISIFFYRLGDQLYNQHMQFHLLILVLFLIPIKLLSKKLDKPTFFKYILFSLYVFYILSIAFVDNKIDVFSLVALLSICVFPAIYLSEVLYLISSVIIVFFTMAMSKNLLLYAPRSSVELTAIYRVLLVVIILLGFYVALTKAIHLMRDILSDNLNPYTDKLTGVYNKHYLKERMSNIPYKEGLQLSIIAIDVDNMKEINAKYGASSGDIILQGFTNILQASIRQSDSICRTEGDEFALIIQHPNEFKVINLAERLKSTVENKKFNVLDKDRNQSEANITSSFGVATLKEGEDSEALLKRAEKALREAKKGGKNKIELGD